MEFLLGSCYLDRQLTHGNYQKKVLKIQNLYLQAPIHDVVHKILEHLKTQQLHH